MQREQRMNWRKAAQAILVAALSTGAFSGCATMSEEERAKSEAELAKLQEEFAEAALLAEIRLQSAMRGEKLVVESTFDLEEVAFIHEQGTNTLQGEAFLRQQGGGLVTCAGTSVTLVPDGHYSRERAVAFYDVVQEGVVTFVPIRGYYRDSYGKHLPDAPQAYHEASLETRCDSAGRFRFDNLAGGSYFASVEILWQVGKSYQGGRLMTPVTLSGGETKNVVMAQ